MTHRIAPLAAVLAVALCGGCANAPDEDEVVNPQIHRAWLLPESDIAIYEQRPTEFNDAVVQSMQVLR
jgi:hypothetical protein